MVMKYRRVSDHFPEEEVMDKKAQGPTFADIAGQARRALRFRKGTDVTGLSHNERNKIIFGD